MIRSRPVLCLVIAAAVWAPPGACGSPGAAEPPPSWTEAANATYAGPMGMPFSLQDGEWMGDPYVEGGAAAPRAGLARDFLLVGDLDGDGKEESVVLVWTATGGSGTFDYLAVVGRGADGSVGERASAPLGDRVQVRAARIADDRLVLETVQSGTGDAMCCPGQLMRRSFTLENGTMTESSTEDLGRLSLAELDGEWTLLELDGKPVAENVQVTAVFEKGQLSGKAACNRYSGQVKAGDTPGDVALAGPLAVTRMMCPPPLMEWEQHYLRALQGLRKFSFNVGRLVLTWSDDDHTGRMDFTAASPSSDLAAE